MARVLCRWFRCITWGLSCTPCCTQVGLSICTPAPPYVHIPLPCLWGQGQGCLGLSFLQKRCQARQPAGNWQLRESLRRGEEPPQQVPRPSCEVCVIQGGREVALQRGAPKRRSGVRTFPGLGRDPDPPTSAIPCTPMWPPTPQTCAPRLGWGRDFSACLEGPFHPVGSRVEFMEDQPPAAMERDLRVEGHLKSWGRT